MVNQVLGGATSSLVLGLGQDYKSMSSTPVSCRKGDDPDRYCKGDRVSHGDTDQGLWEGVETRTVDLPEVSSFLSP